MPQRPTSSMTANTIDSPPPLSIPNAPNPRNSTMSMRMLHRTSGLWNMFTHRNDSSSSILTTRTVLPQYTPVDPASSDTGDDVSTSASPESSGSSSLYQSDEAGPGRALPRYSTVNLVRGSQSFESPSTQESTSGMRRGAHTYSFPLRGSNPWVTLTLQGRTEADASSLPHTHPTSSRAQNQNTPRPSLPRVYGGQPLEGAVELDIPKSQSKTINEIRVVVKGKVVVSVVGGYTFFNHAVVVWNRASGDPERFRVNGDYDGGGDEEEKEKDLEAFSGKFTGGRYRLPFSDILPTEVNRDLGPLAVPNGGMAPFHVTGSSSTTTASPPRSPLSSSSQAQGDEQTVSRFGTLLPPSLREHDISATVRYEIHVQVSHGRFRPETRLTTGICYVPTVTPPSLSPRRRMVYESISLMSRSPQEQYGVMIDGPGVDPGGWVALPPAVMRGLTPDTGKPVKVECVLYLAKPLSYTRTTHIPLFFSITSDDSQLLNTLSTPSTPHIRLIRRIKHPTHYDDEYSQSYNLALGGMDLSDGNSGPRAPASVQMKRTESVTWGEKLGCTTAWWVPLKDVEHPEGQGGRWLGGEIHLPGGMVPSSECTFSSVEYFIELLGLKSSACVFEEGQDHVYATQPVEIASTYAKDGPVPIPFTRPPFQAPRR
ncbi:hypothetical protein BJ165DRAFT_1530559 [Panaeolus papilionaceus]|nr:hypothetical protein BJ165DRAFT_1530559 [Panaeolus papilionaceus]